MRNNLKQFLLGALLALVPLSFYAEIKFKSNKYVLTYEYDPKYLSSKDINIILSARPTQITTITPSPTIAVTSQILLKPTHIPQENFPQTEAKTSAYTISNIQVPDNIHSLIDKYAKEYGVDKNMMIGIARCESNFRENAVNGPYAGIYQFVSSTWISNRNAMGLSSEPNLRFNPEESVKTAAFKMSRDGFGAWPVCQNIAKLL